MTTIAASSARVVRRPRASWVRMIALESKYELLKLVRLPAYIVPTLAFPVLFYLLFGVIFGRATAGGVSMSTYLVATYGAFGVLGAALFGFGVNVATERGQGWLLLKRATPMPPVVAFAAKLVMAVVFGAAIVVLLAIAAVTVGGVRLPPATWLRLGAALVAGAVPASALGLALGFIAGPNSAVPIVNLIYLPLAFGSGLWLPVEILPRLLQRIAMFLPPYHHAQLALAAIGADRGGPDLGPRAGARRVHAARRRGGLRGVPA